MKTALTGFLGLLTTGCAVYGPMTQYDIDRRQARYASNVQVVAPLTASESENYKEVGTVTCSEDTPRAGETSNDLIERCRTNLRATAHQLEAAVIVIESQTSVPCVDPSITICGAMTARAYQRVEPTVMYVPSSDYRDHDHNNYSDRGRDRDHDRDRDPRDDRRREPEPPKVPWNSKPTQSKNVHIISDASTVKDNRAVKVLGSVSCVSDKVIKGGTSELHFCFEQLQDKTFAMGGEALTIDQSDLITCTNAKEPGMPKAFCFEAVGTAYASAR